jgi:hypothetical protein
VQYPGARLANAALAIVYSHGLNWRSPTYAAASQTGARRSAADIRPHARTHARGRAGAGQLTVWLNDVTGAGLVVKEPANARTAGGSRRRAADTVQHAMWR